MSKFNPSNAVPVAEDDDLDEMDTFLDRLDAKARTLRTQIVADAFRELLTVAKQERAQLLAAASKDFSDMVSEKVESAVSGCMKNEDGAGMSTAIAEQTAMIKAGIDRLQKTLGAQAELIRGSQSDTSLADVTRSIATLQSTISSQPKPQSMTDHPQLAQILEAVKAPRPIETTLRPTWNFRIERDERARIVNVVATPV